MTLAQHLAEMNAKTLAWVAEDPKNRWAGTLTEDLDHWAKMKVFTPYDLDLYLTLASYSDYYKDIHGCRPRMDWDVIDLATAEKMMADLTAYADTLPKEFWD